MVAPSLWTYFLVDMHRRKGILLIYSFLMQKQCGKFGHFDAQSIVHSIHYCRNLLWSIDLIRIYNVSGVHIPFVIISIKFSCCVLHALSISTEVSFIFYLQFDFPL